MTLNTAIKSWQIQPATISGGHLAVSNSVSGTQVLSYDSSEDSFKWDYLATVTINEVPSGDIDGSNKEFTLSNTPLEDSERVYLNGLLQEPGSGKDYTIDGNKITFTIAPESGDVVLVSYLIMKNTIAAFNYAYRLGAGTIGGPYWSISSIVERIQFPFDSGVSINVGNLSRNVYRLAGNNSSIYGYAVGGEGYNPVSIVDRITFPFDSGIATRVGNLAGNSGWHGANNNSVYGYVVGGEGRGYDYDDIIDRFQFPFDSGTATQVGNLNNSAEAVAASNSSTYGYKAGGRGKINDEHVYISELERFQFPFDSGTATKIGKLNTNRLYHAANNSSMYGYVLCGWGTDALSSVERFQFPFDSGTAVHTGNAAKTLSYVAGANSSVHGYALGSGDIIRFQFPFDSGTAADVGDLNLFAREPGVCDTTDFVSMFI